MNDWASERIQWSILSCLSDGPRDYGQIRVLLADKIDGLSDQHLSRELESLSKAGVIELVSSRQDPPVFQLATSGASIHLPARLSIYVDPGSATPDQIAELLHEYSKLYKMLGGSGISFVLEDVRASGGVLV